jgi:hypothetical protein
VARIGGVQRLPHTIDKPPGFAVIEADGLAVQIGVSDNVHDRKLRFFCAVFSVPSVCARASRYLGVKGKILAVDLPHKLGAKFNCLFKLLFGLAL